ncbi:MAG: hypothetical protein JXM79_04535 [Sedimentisphaerales bacterium]|nr:hypothetical protein [Sedimentisphaerales bacterium]
MSCWWLDSVNDAMPEQLLKKSNVDFLLIREDSPTRRLTDQFVRLRLIEQIEAWQLYEVVMNESSDRSAPERPSPFPPRSPNLRRCDETSDPPC